MSSLSSLLHTRAALECRRFGATSYNIYTWSLAICLGIYTLKYPESDRATLFEGNRSFSAAEICALSSEEFHDHVIKRLDKYSVRCAVNNTFSLLWSGLSEASGFAPLLKIWADLDGGGLLDAVDHLSHEFIFKFYSEAQTPQWLNRLAVLLIAPTNGSFYDGTAGIGDTAFEALQYAERSGGSLSIHTSELDHLFFSISFLRAWLKGVEMHQSNHDCLRQKLQNCFDFSIMFPPLGEQGRSRHSAGNDAKNSTDWQFAQHLFRTLSEHGTGVCCVFSGALFNARSAKARQSLLEQNVIDAIISFPSNTLSYTAVPISLLVFRRDRKPGEAVRLIDASTLIDGSGVTDPLFPEQIVQLYRADTPVSGVARCIPPEELTGKNLLPAAYLEKEHISVLTSNWGELHIRSIPPDDWVALGSATQIYTGVNSNLIASEDDGIPVQLIRLSDVQDDRLQPDIPFSYLRESSAQKAASSQVRAWDILISAKGNAIKLCLITDEDAMDAVHPLYLSQHFLGIHVDQGCFDPRYIGLAEKDHIYSN